jgi:hypothetical protein
MQNAKILERQSLLGPFILMCTRFGNVVHFKGIDKFFMARRDMGASEKWLNGRFEAWRRDAHDLADFVMLAKEVATAYADHQIVLRPHPSEDPVFYERAFKPYRNILVTRDGSSLDWIRSAKLVVHCNCTTGVEAVLANKPAVNFLPNAVSRDGLDKLVAREAGTVAHSINSAVEEIGAILGGNRRDCVWSPEANAILSNLTQEAIPLVAEQIKSVIETNIAEGSEVIFPKKSMRSAIAQILGRGASHEMVSDAYLASKRSAFDMQHARAIIDGCRQRGLGPARLSVSTPSHFVVEPL